MKLLLLFLLSWKGCTSGSTPPVLDVGDEVVFTKDIILSCKGSEPLHWKTHVEEDYYKVNNSSGREDDYPYVSNFTLNETIPADVGYYCCHYEGVTDCLNDTENADSTYVYVKNDDNPFVPFSLDPETVKLSKTLVIDCRVTHPNVTVYLIHNKKNITNDRRVSFDPRKGFTVKDVDSNDKGLYECDADNGNVLTKQIRVDVQKPIRKPAILKGKNQHYVKGDSFHLECKVVDLEEDLTFTWTYPNRNAKHEQKDVSTTQHNRNILTVHNASLNDSGSYTCTIKTPTTLPNNASENITIIEAMAPFVNITTSSSNITHDEGSEFRWIVDMLYYPYDPVIKYTNWKGQQLNKSNRLQFEHNKIGAQSSLLIKNLTSSDFGDYTITVSTPNGAASDSATIKLAINSTPRVEFKGVPDYLAEGESLEINCLAVGYPRANVTLQFQECSSGIDSCSSSVYVNETEEDFPAPGNIVKKSANFTPQTSGQLWCTGQNENGSGNSTVPVRISDIDGVFVLRHHGENNKTTEGSHDVSVSVVENDYFSLICGGSKLDYKTTSLTHTSPDSSSPRIIPPVSSNFSWKSERKVEGATKELAGRYDCTAEPYRDQQPQSKTITIIVLDEKPVQFGEKSNMRNKTEELPENKGFGLNCSVTGMPEPSILWLKDGKNLTLTSQAYDENEMKFISNSTELTFHHVLKRHEGVYTCVAKNRINEVKGSLTIKVQRHQGMSSAIIVGLSLACAGIAVLFFLVIVLVIHVWKERKYKREMQSIKDLLLPEGNMGQLNPNCTIDEQASCLPYDPKWEVPRENIKFGKLLGSGAFGEVLKATITGVEDLSVTTVAAKKCKSKCDPTQLRSLVMELKIMIHLGKHLNIVNLMGANTTCLDKGELLILVEFCRFGNLLNFMHRHRKRFINQVDAATGKINFEKSTSDSLSPSSPSSCNTPAPANSSAYLEPTSPRFILSDPPQGHAAKSVSPPTGSHKDSAEDSLLPLIPGGQEAHNPLYFMNVNTEGTKEGTGRSEGCNNSHAPQDRDSTQQTPGSNTVPSITLMSPRSTTTTLSRMTSYPFSPADSIMGEGHLDSKGNAFTYDVGSVPAITTDFTTSDLLSWGWQVAKGMEYLSKRNVLHGDLAVRNLLLADNNVVKISDFGMSRDIYRKTIYVKQEDALLPVKWMSVEAIRDRIFSVQSDVWAFGITLWEIFSLGSMPYPGIEINTFLKQLEEGHRMECPKYANQDIYSIMMQCWRADPMDRPSFSQLVESLGSMMLQTLKEEYLIMDEAYMKMNEERFENETDYLKMLVNPNFESLTRAEEPDASSYINVQVSTCNAVESDPLQSPASSTSTNYLPMMGSSGQSSPSPQDISPQPKNPSRFTFSTVFNEGTQLPSLHEEEETELLERKESPTNSTWKKMKEPSPSENTPSNMRDDNPIMEKTNNGPNYINM